jgi:hypothetical protein
VDECCSSGSTMTTHGTRSALGFGWPSRTEANAQGQEKLSRLSASIRFTNGSTRIVATSVGQIVACVTNNSEGNWGGFGQARNGFIPISWPT